MKNREESTGEVLTMTPIISRSNGTTNDSFSLYDISCAALVLSPVAVASGILAAFMIISFGVPA